MHLLETCCKTVKATIIFFFESCTTGLDNCLGQMNYNRQMNHFWSRIFATREILFFSDWMVGNWCGSFLYIQIVRNPFSISKSGNGWVNYSGKWRDQTRWFRLKTLYRYIIRPPLFQCVIIRAMMIKLMSL